MIRVSKYPTPGLESGGGPTTAFLLQGNNITPGWETPNRPTLQPPENIIDCISILLLLFYFDLLPLLPGCLLLTLILIQLCQ